MEPRGVRPCADLEGRPLPAPPSRRRISLLRRSAEVELWYSDAGSGEPPLLLVHGWMCDHTYLAPQAEFFGGSQRIVSLDLRGHGLSSAPVTSCTVPNFASDLRWLASALHLRRPVLIGHSMGGVAGYELAAAYPDVLSGLVLIDSPVAANPARGSARRRLVDDLCGPGWRDAARAFVENMFVPADSPQLRARIIDGMLDHEPELMAAAMESMLGCQSFSAETAAPVDIPVLQISTARGALPDLGRLAELCPRLSNGQVVGAGHFCQIEDPYQVNAMIARWLAVNF
ncbi:MAG: alpha/beta hydrolase [Chloroflexi bacterium]|nr:alpha/beta hydrolase [Chloroflexota bacterium]